MALPLLAIAAGGALAKGLGGFLSGRSKRKAAQKAAKGQNQAQRNRWENSETRRIANLRTLQGVAGARGLPITIPDELFVRGPNPGVDMTTQLPGYSTAGDLLSGAGGMALDYATSAAGAPGGTPSADLARDQGAWSSYIDDLLRQLNEGQASRSAMSPGQPVGEAPYYLRRP